MCPSFFTHSPTHSLTHLCLWRRIPGSARPYTRAPFRLCFHHRGQEAHGRGGTTTKQCQARSRHAYQGVAAGATSQGPWRGTDHATDHDLYSSTYHYRHVCVVALAARRHSRCWSTGDSLFARGHCSSRPRSVPLAATSSFSTICYSSRGRPRRSTSSEHSTQLAPFNRCSTFPIAKVRLLMRRRSCSF